MRCFWNVLRTLEHHVFKKMRETGSSFFFIARTDVVVNGDRNDWYRPVRTEDHTQTIVQRELFDRDGRYLKIFSHKDSLVIWFVPKIKGVLYPSRGTTKR